ncbi:unnamed protein product [Adineta steineri]|uniref:ADP-ribosylhydrolase ARH3 n=1 Tax=Adineta steineri TaxID=433720 RepID=A0A814CZ82_9BILA|nr:unnamed protein product [Adineta steineri]CAF0950050.1 unnamed protein product [Adineta steineri]CAF4198558.1 unnamed protein product [Adineta steineri]CAF4250900.1 unnamed protein product [Adineta steineri]
MSNTNTFVNVLKIASRCDGLFIDINNTLYCSMSWDHKISDEDSFEKGVLAAVNLGDDTDTTAAIYGQLAGAYYGYKELPKKWIKHVYAKQFILNVSEWIAHEGKKWNETEGSTSSHQSQPDTTYRTTPDESKSFFQRIFAFFNYGSSTKHSAPPSPCSPQQQKETPITVNRRVNVDNLFNILNDINPIQS